jgi:hypothetical protein
MELYFFRFGVNIPILVDKQGDKCWLQIIELSHPHSRQKVRTKKSNLAEMFDVITMTGLLTITITVGIE